MQRLLLCCLEQNISELNLESKHLFGLPVLLEGADGPHRAAKDLAAAATQDTAQTAQGAAPCAHARMQPSVHACEDNSKWPQQYKAPRSSTTEVVILVVGPFLISFLISPP